MDCAARRARPRTLRPACRAARAKQIAITPSESVPAGGQVNRPQRPSICALQRPVQAHRNGLWDVKEARTSPLLPPESRRLASLISDFLRKQLVYFAEKFGMHPTYSARNTDFFFAEKSGMNVRNVFAAFRSSNAAKSQFRDKNRTVSRIGYFSVRRTQRRIGERLRIF